MVHNVNIFTASVLQFQSHCGHQGWVLVGFPVILLALPSTEWWLVEMWLQQFCISCQHWIQARGKELFSWCCPRGITRNFLRCFKQTSACIPGLWTQSCVCCWPSHWRGARDCMGAVGSWGGASLSEPHEFGHVSDWYINKTADLSGKGRGVGAGSPPTLAAPERLYVGLLIITWTHRLTS